MMDAEYSPAAYSIKTIEVSRCGQYQLTGKAGQYRHSSGRSVAEMKIWIDGEAAHPE